MGHDIERSSGSGGAAIALAVVAMVLLLLVGFAVAGAGAWRYLAARLTRQQALIQLDTARVEAEFDASEVVGGQGVEQLVVTLDDQGQIQFDGQPIQLPQLQAELDSRMVNDNDALGVLIRADGECVFDRIVAVMDVCQRAGIDDIRMETFENEERTESSTP